jgi:hypothetical protein
MPELAMINIAAPTARVVRERPALHFLNSPRQWKDGTFQAEWCSFLRASGRENLMYQSPEWFAYLQETGQGDTLQIAVARDESETPVGVVPLCAHRGSIPFNAGGRRLWSLPTRQVTLLGGEPLLPPDRELHDRLFRSIGEVFPDFQTVLMAAVPCESFVWRYLQESQVIRDHYLLYVVEGISRYYMLRLPENFGDYLAQFSRKKRYNMKRQSRLLSEHCGSEVELVRVHSPADVAFWIKACDAIDDSHWPAESSRRTANRHAISHRRMLDLTNRGLMRSYVLRAGDQFIGYISGCQHRDTYFAWDITYDKRFSSLSPGATMLHLMIEDLLGDRPARLINFGFGEPRRLLPGQTAGRYASVLLFRKSLANRILRAAHHSFRSLVGLARSCFKRDRLPEAPVRSAE